MSIGTNWSGNYRYRASRVHTPTSLEQLQQVVAAAPRIRALGSRHCFNDLADSNELVSVLGLDSPIEVDASARTVSLNAGLSYGALAPVLQSRGWALRNMASLPHISVAGAVATGTHGSGRSNSGLATAVSGLEVVTAEGSLVALRRGTTDFDGAVVSLGALGIVHRVTLDIEPSYEVRQDVYEGLLWPALMQNFDEVAGAACSVSIFTKWVGAEVGAVWLKSRVDAGPPPAGLLGALPVAAERHPLPGSSPETTTTQGGVPGPWNERLPHFKLEFTPSNGRELQSEYLVPYRFAVPALEAVRELGALIAPHLMVSELRTIAADGLWLSGAYETDVLGIHFTWQYEPDEVAALLPVIEDALAPFDARPHWGKLFHAVAPRAYPRLPDFVTLARAYDPAGKFSNEFLERTVFA